MAIKTEIATIKPSALTPLLDLFQFLQAAVPETVPKKVHPLTARKLLKSIEWKPDNLGEFGAQGHRLHNGAKRVDHNE